MEQELDTTAQRLRGLLYRFDCPSPLTLGEYVLDILAGPARTEIARHALECGLCSQELRETRAFLAIDLPVPAPGVWHELRRVVATLLSPSAQSAYGMARGSESTTGSEYRAGPIAIVVGDMRGKRRGTVSIDGLILHALAPPEALASREVTLSDTAQRRVHATRTDDLGSFAFEDIAVGNYRLEVTLQEEVVVVEEVHVGS